MTVGITFTNGLEAIVITDSRVSELSRESDSASKMGMFKKDSYHGIVFGSGSAVSVLSIIEELDVVDGNSVEDYAAALHEKLHSHEKKILNLNLQVEHEHIHRKAQLILDEKARAQFIEQEIGKLMQGYEKYRNDSPNLQTNLVITAYAAERVRLFSINRIQWEERFDAHGEIGSGTDGANLYLGAALQGINTKMLTAGELLFYVVNAYSYATLNIGVGGTPKIAHFSQRSSRILPVEQTRLLTNISSAYTSRYTPTLTPQRMKKYCTDILAGQNVSLSHLAQMLNMTPNSLQTMAIPYSIWQERANSR